MIHIFKNLKFDGKQMNSTFEAKYLRPDQLLMPGKIGNKIEARPNLRPGQPLGGTRFHSMPTFFGIFKSSVGFSVQDLWFRFRFLFFAFFLSDMTGIRICVILVKWTLLYSTIILQKSVSVFTLNIQLYYYNL